MDSRNLLIGIDVGSSSIRAEIFDAEGRSLGQARQPNSFVQPRVGVAEYDGDAMTFAVLACLRELVECAKVKPGEVAGLALDGMISGVMGIDDDWRPTTRYTTPLDMRYGPTLDRIMARHGGIVREMTGSGMAVIGPKIAWTKDEDGTAFTRTKKFLTATGYIAGKLVGLGVEEAFVDHTYLWTTGLSDTQNYRWSEELCAIHGISVALLPRIVSSTNVIGRLTKEMGRVSGLGEGVPLVAGAGDQSAGFVGAGLTRPGMLADVAGTYPILSLCTDRFVPDTDARRIELFPSPIRGQYHACHVINGGGLTHQWFGREIGGAVNENSLAEVFSELDEKAAPIAPGCDGLFCLPHLGGRVCPAHTSMKGAWLGFSWTHKREHFYRAFLESVAMEHAVALRVLHRLYPTQRPMEILGFGGGVKSRLWNSIKADVLGMPYRALDRVDQATWGGAILAGCGVGLFADIATAAEKGRAGGVSVPHDVERNQAYAKVLSAYEKVMPLLEEAFLCLPN